MGPIFRKGYYGNITGIEKRLIATEALGFMAVGHPPAGSQTYI
jgi:hypothetical protein